MMKKILAILLATLMSATMSASIAVVNAQSYHNGHAPANLQTQQVLMDDTIIKCAAMGGQIVDIGVFIKNIGQTTITEDFVVWLYISQVSPPRSVPVTHDFLPGEIWRVPILDTYIGRECGSYTLDSYINDDLATRKYCSFTVTLLGMQ